MKKLVYLICVLLVILFVGGCTAGPNDWVDTPDEEGEIAGFWQGLWQGFIAPFTFLVSLFSDAIHVYEVHNNGNWYNFGFVIGAVFLIGGSHGARSARR